MNRHERADRINPEKERNEIGRIAPEEKYDGVRDIDQLLLFPT
jgi:hypothetical protein